MGRCIEANLDRGNPRAFIYECAVSCLCFVLCLFRRFIFLLAFARVRVVRERLRYQLGISGALADHECASFAVRMCRFFFIFRISWKHVDQFFVYFIY